MGEVLKYNPETAEPSQKPDLEKKILAPKRGPKANYDDYSISALYTQSLDFKKAIEEAKNEKERVSLEKRLNSVERLLEKTGLKPIEIRHKVENNYNRSIPLIEKLGEILDKLQKTDNEIAKRQLQNEINGFKKMLKEKGCYVTDETAIQHYQQKISKQDTKKSVINDLQKSEGMHGDIAAWENLPQEQPAVMSEVKVDESVARENWLARWLRKREEAKNEKAVQKFAKMAEVEEAKAVDFSDLEPTPEEEEIIRQKTAVNIPATRTTTAKRHKFEELSEPEAAPTKDEIRVSAQEVKDAKKGAIMDSRIDKMDLDNEEETIPSARDLVASAQKMEKETKRKSTLMRMEAGNAIQGNKNMDAMRNSLEKINSQMAELQPLITSTKIGWFGKLKIDKGGYITNLPQNDEQVVIEQLIKQKEKLGAKGRVEEANKIVDQIEALEKYPDLLLQRDKLMPN
ncbi:MAG: hypothetical protein ABIJ23_00025 [Candidatus Magasanikbacteria bacterium]